MSQGIPTNGHYSADYTAVLNARGVTDKVAELLWFYGSSSYGIQHPEFGPLYQQYLIGLGITDHVLIDVSDLRRISYGTVFNGGNPITPPYYWVDKFYDPNRGLIDDSVMRSHTQVAAYTIANLTGLNPDYASIHPATKFGAFIQPEKLRASNLADVSELTLSNTNLSPAGMLKYYF